MKLQKKFLFFASIALLSLIAGCNNEPPQPTEPYTPSGTTFQHEGDLTFTNEQDSVLKELQIEIAETEEAVMQGMMWRKSMPEHQGMLFIFPESEPRSFWMKNTIIPLDMIFIGEDQTIVSIKERTTPFSEQSVNSDGKNAKYVLEVNAGFCAKYSLKPGDKMNFSRR